MTAEAKVLGPIKVEVSQTDIIDIPSMYSNIYNISVTPNYTRITFGESVGTPKAKFHTAIALLSQDAKTLAESILSALNKADEVKKSS